MSRRPISRFFWFASLALCVATAALWARSYFAEDAVDWGTRSGRAGVFSTHGRLGFGHVIVPAAAMTRIPHGLQYRADPSGSQELKPSWSSWTGMQATYVAQRGFTASDLRLPYWMLMVAAIAAALWLRRTSRRPTPGYCPACGYDLRATHERCPECGHPGTLRSPG